MRIAVFLLMCLKCVLRVFINLQQAFLRSTLDYDPEKFDQKAHLISHLSQSIKTQLYLGLNLQNFRLASQILMEKF